MHKSELQFVHSTLIMEHLFGDNPLDKRAQDAGGSGAFDKVKNELLHGAGYDPAHPVESVLAFIGPGLLWVLGFKKIAAAVSLAEALGFNWTSFFASIRAKVAPLLNDLHDGKSRDTSDVKSIVQDAGEEAFQGQVDVDKLQDVTEKYGSLNNMIYIQKVAQSYKKDPKVMQAIERLLNGAAGNRMRKSMLGFIIRIVAWLISAVIIASGLKLAGVGIARMLGTDKDKQEENSSGTTNTDSNDKIVNEKEEIDNHPSDKDLSLTLNRNANPELFSTSYNDNNHVWLLSIPIANIQQTLITWAQELYPQLTDKGAFDASSSFNRTLRMFKERNKDASELQVIGVPQPFKSIKEIVDSFAADVASHMANSTKYAQRKL